MVVFKNQLRQLGQGIGRGWLYSGTGNSGFTFPLAEACLSTAGLANSAIKSLIPGRLFYSTAVQIK
jgi:hypothetical protein